MGTKPVENSALVAMQPGYSSSGLSSGGNLSFDEPLFDLGLGSGLDGGIDTMDMYLYGPLSMNKRLFTAYRQQAAQCGYDWEVKSITAEDQNNLQPLSKRLDEHRISKVRMFDGEGVTQALEEAKNSGMGVALYLTNCAQDGLKNPNVRSITFDNLVNPERLVNRLKNLSLIAPQANKNIELLCDIAIKERSHELAAVLLEATSKGDITGLGVDNKTAKKLLIDSKSQFRNDAEYHKFLTTVDKSYKRLYPDKKLGIDDYVKQNYKPTWQKATPIAGTVAGAFLLAKSFGPVAGAIAGGLAGLAVYSSTWFGRNAKGKELIAALDKSRNNSHDYNVSNGNFSLGLT